MTALTDVNNVLESERCSPHKLVKRNTHSRSLLDYRGLKMFIPDTLHNRKRMFQGCLCVAWRRGGGFSTVGQLHMKGLINEKQLSAKECTKPLGRPNEEKKTRTHFWQFQCTIIGLAVVSEISQQPEKSIKEPAVGWMIHTTTVVYHSCWCGHFFSGGAAVAQG